MKERERRHLTGQVGRNLYLESLQLMLRNQLLWLINQKGHREELETVVRDLWDLRTRGSSSHALDAAPDDSAADGGLEMFSSQTADLANSEKPKGNKFRRAQSWEPQQGPEWPMPKMLDIIVLNYLGCLLLRIPTRVGEYVQWVNGGHLPYRRAVCSNSQSASFRNHADCSLVL